MPADPMKTPDNGVRPAPEVELPQAPPAAPEGHDAAGPPEAAPPAPEPEVPTQPEAAIDPDAEVTCVQRDLDELTAKAQKAEEYLALAQRTQADFENYRKRALREAKAAQERGVIKLAQALLPAIDDLDRALAHVDVDADAAANGAASLIEGLKHVQAGVVNALSGIGIERYSPQGERFDPQYHEAVAQQPVEGTESGVVVEVFQSGYRMGELVVRPARVVVAG